MAKLETKEYTVARSFDHRTFGRIGVVEMVAEIATVKLGGKELPTASVEYLLTFALQSLQDAYAGADSADDAQARFDKKLTRMMEGTLGQRAGGDGASAETRMTRTVIGEMLRKTEDGKAAWKAHEDDRNEFLDAIYAKQPDAKRAAIDAIVAKRLEEAAARAKQAKELAEGLAL